MFSIIIDCDARIGLELLFQCKWKDILGHKMPKNCHRKKSTDLLGKDQIFESWSKVVFSCSYIC